MQQQQYSAAQMTGDETFPSYLTRTQVCRLLRRHSAPAVVESDGAIRTETWCSKGESGFMAIKRFTPSLNYAGMYRATPILSWLGY